MQCDNARILMGFRLDGDETEGLGEHLDSCPACASAWSELRAVDVLLGAQVMVEAPPHLTSRVMSHIERRTRRRPDWQHSLMQVGAIVSGTLLAVVATLAFVRGWWLALDGAEVLSRSEPLIRGVTVMSGMANNALGQAALTWPLYAALAVALALAWFGVLVVPRFAPRTAR